MLTLVFFVSFFLILAVLTLASMTAFLVMMSMATSEVVAEAHRDTYSMHRRVTLDRFAQS